MLLGAKIDFVITYVQVSFNMSDAETNLLKFELGISNDLASLLYLPLVNGDNNFICGSSAEIIILSAARQFVKFHHGNEVIL
jgi:hypothetical protein